MTFDLNDDLRAPELNIAVGAVAYKDIDQSVTSSTVLVSDESIGWDVLAGALYHLTAHLMYLTEDTPDIKFGWSIPSGAAMVWNGTGYSTGSVHQNFGNADPSAGATSFGGSGGGTARVARATGTLLMGDEDGELRLQFAQNVSNAATTTVLQGTFGVLRRVA